MISILAIIKELHKSYVTSDNEVMKQDQLLPQLRDKSKAILCQLNHDRIFTQDEFLKLLAENIAERNDFNALGTSKAFDALEKYAVNLLNSPWRKEFYTIKLFGGFYRQKVASHLHGAEKILKLMNYRVKDESTLVIEGIVDKQKLMEVSLNCQFASCECEIMHQIFKTVHKNGKEVSYKDIFRIRNKFPSHPEDCVEFFCKDDIRETIGSGDRRLAADNYPGRKTAYRDEVRVGKLIDISSPGADKHRENFLYPDEAYETSRKVPKLTADHAILNGKGLNANLQKDLKDRTPEHLKPGTQENHIQASLRLVENNRREHDWPETRNESWGYVDNTLKRDDDVDGYRTNFDNELRSRTLPRQDETMRAHQAALQAAMIPAGMPLRHRGPESDLMNFVNPEAYSAQGSLPAIPPVMVPMTPQYWQYLYNETWMKMHSNRDPPMFPVTPVYPQIDPITTSLSAMTLRDPSNFVDHNQFVRSNGVGSTAGNRNSYYENCQEQPNDRGPETPPNRNGYKSSHIGSSGRSSHSEETHHSRQYQTPNESLCSASPPRPPPPYDDDDHFVEHEASPAPIRSAIANNTRSKKNNSTQNNGHSNTGKNRPQTYSSAVSNTLKQEKAIPPPTYQQAIEEPTTVSDGSSSSARSSESNRINSSTGGTWECPHCTFANNNEKEICDMCGRSKEKGAESIPLVAGGRECPQCTLINEQNARSCVACSCSLKDSSTYI